METLMDDILKLTAERLDKQEVSAIQTMARKLAMLPTMIDDNPSMSMDYMHVALLIKSF